VKDIPLDALADILPIGRRKCSGINGRTSFFDFGGPGDIDIRLRIRIKTLEKADCDFGAIFFRQSQHLIE
jgi:hypothetical protein